MSFAWARTGGNQVSLPTTWPSIGQQPITQWRLRDISYGFNVCTFSYTQVWYKFREESPDSGFEDSWESILDWMALSGINLALAYTGQEEVYRKVYAGFGVNESEFAAWSNGPAHLTWSRGQSMHGVGGPLPTAWMREQWDLQRQILSRMRELGIVPILPAFQGNVPPLLANLYPKANITVQKAHWGGGRAAWLDATDPLFQSIGDAFMKQLIQDFGIDSDGDGLGEITEHWYEADGYFAAGDPPWRRLAAADGPGAADDLGQWSHRSAADLELLPGAVGAGDDFQNAFAHASRAYMAMNSTDPEARWMYQGWILGTGDKDLQVMRGYAAAVPRGRLLVSDMWAEWRPISGMLSAAGVPYIYGVLQNFGGTLYLGMSVDALNTGASEDPAGVPSIFDTFEKRPGAAGIGAFPEGIDQNPAYYTFFFDTLWQAGPVPDLPGWWRQYSVQRYGGFSAAAAAAWTALGSTVYGIDVRKGATQGGFWREKSKGGVLSAPLLHDVSDSPAPPWYNASVVLGAWEGLVAAAPQLPGGAAKAPKTLLYDVVNVGREILDRVADPPALALAGATSAAAALAAGQKLLEVQQDADALLCTQKSFRMSAWTDAAVALGAADGLGAFYDRMARAQVTTWLPACRNASELAGGVCSLHASDAQAPPLEDYANKAWGGLVGHYYTGRVRCYLSEWSKAPASATAVNVTAFHACVDELAREFQGDSAGAKFPLCRGAPGDTLGLSRSLIAKYREEVHGLPGPDVRQSSTADLPAVLI